MFHRGGDMDDCFKWLHAMLIICAPGFAQEEVAPRRKEGVLIGSPQQFLGCVPSLLLGINPAFPPTLQLFCFLIVVKFFLSIIILIDIFQKCYYPRPRFSCSFLFPQLCVLSWLTSLLPTLLLCLNALESRWSTRGHTLKRKLTLTLPTAIGCR